MFKLKLISYLLEHIFKLGKLLNVMDPEMQM